MLISFRVNQCALRHDTEIHWGWFSLEIVTPKRLIATQGAFSLVCLHLGCGSLWTVTALLAQTFPLDPEPSQPGQQVRPRLCAAHPNAVILWMYASSSSIRRTTLFSVKLLRTLRSSRLIAATCLLLPRHFAPKPYISAHYCSHASSAAAPFRPRTILSSRCSHASWTVDNGIVSVLIQFHALYSPRNWISTGADFHWSLKYPTILNQRHINGVI